MKRTSYFIIAAAVLFFGACSSPVIERDPIDNSQQEESTLTTITAGFDNPNTKTILHFANSDDHFPGVYWQSGDSFKLYPVFTSGFYPPETYTTSFTGDPKPQAEFTGEPVSTAEHFVAVYPSAADGGIFSISTTFGAGGIIPKLQTATAGSYDPAANLAFAYSPAASGYDHLTFQNMTTLLKVRVTGSKATNLESIRIQNTDFNMAGLIVASNFDSEIQIAKNQPHSSNSQSVTLQGTFSVGNDYYIAVAPGTYNNLSVVFFFKDKSFISKTVSTSTVLTRSTIRNLGTFDMDEASNFTVYNQASAGAAKPVTLCVIPDGYTAGQRSTFEARATAGMDYLFSVDPYKSFKQYFNVFFIWTPSAEEGATITDGHGAPVTVKNTAFSSQWGSDSYSDMQADENAVFSFVAANCPDILQGTLTIDDVAVLLLINDTRYGGIAHSSIYGRTYCMVPYIGAGGPQQWQINTTVPASSEPTNPLTSRTLTSAELNDLYGTEKTAYIGDWRNVLLHEFGGHSFGRLLDEYWHNSYVPEGEIGSHLWPVPMGLNVTGFWYDGVFDNLPSPWKELMEMKASLVTSNSKYSRIDVFHGGNDSMFNRWRSEMISCMIDNRPYFSALQRILIAQRIIEKSGGTFDLSTYMNTKDKPDDPVRDISGSPVLLPITKASATPRPMLPPPVIHTDW